MDMDSFVLTENRLQPVLSSIILLFLSSTVEHRLTTYTFNNHLVLNTTFFRLKRK